MVTDTDPGLYNIPGAAVAAGSVPVTPAPVTAVTNANIPAAGTFTFPDFNIDSGPVLDVMLFSDVKIDIAIFVRSDASQPFRQLNAAVFASGTAGVLVQPILGQRIAGSICRIQLQNNGAVGSAALSCEVRFQGF